MSEKLQTHVERVGAVLVVAASGAATRADALHLREVLRAMLLKEPADVLLLDLRAVVYLLSGDDKARLLNEVIARPLRTPVAVVTSPGKLAAAREFALRLAEHGVIRLVYGDFTEALRWALQHAARRSSPPCATDSGCSSPAPQPTS